MDVAPSSRSQDLVDRLGDFIADRVLPAEASAAAEREAAPTDQPPTVERLKQEPKDLGLWNLCVRNPDHGPGLAFVDYAPLAEMMGPHPLAQEAQTAMRRRTSTATPSSSTAAPSRRNAGSSRNCTLRTTWLMDHDGDKAAAPHMSLIKVQFMRTTTTVLDRAIQVVGAAGVSDDTPMARWYASIRSLRIADRPDDVHLMGIARSEPCPKRTPLAANTVSVWSRPGPS